MFISWALRTQEVLQGCHPLYFDTFFENISELHHIFKLPLNWENLIKHEKYLIFHQAHCLMHVTLWKNCSYLQWLAHRICDKCPTPSIFTLFRDIFVVTFYIQIAINLDQIWKILKISIFSKRAILYDFNHTNSWFIPLAVRTQQALQGLHTIGHFGICQRNNSTY